MADPVQQRRLPAASGHQDNDHWTRENQEIPWETRFQQLRQFKEAVGHANPVWVAHGPLFANQLACWLSYQRSFFRQGIHLTPVQIELLRAIGALGFDPSVKSIPNHPSVQLLNAAPIHYIPYAQHQPGIMVPGGHLHQGKVLGTLAAGAEPHCNPHGGGNYNNNGASQGHAAMKSNYDDQILMPIAVGQPVGTTGQTSAAEGGTSQDPSLMEKLRAFDESLGHPTGQGWLEQQELFCQENALPSSQVQMHDDWSNGDSHGIQTTLEAGCLGFGQGYYFPSHPSTNSLGSGQGNPPDHPSINLQENPPDQQSIHLQGSGDGGHYPNQQGINLQEKDQGNPPNHLPSHQSANLLGSAQGNPPDHQIIPSHQSIISLGSGQENPPDHQSINMQGSGDGGQYPNQQGSNLQGKDQGNPPNHLPSHQSANLLGSVQGNPPDHQSIPSHQSIISLGSGQENPPDHQSINLQGCGDGGHYPNQLGINMQGKDLTKPCAPKSVPSADPLPSKNVPSTNLQGTGAVAPSTAKDELAQPCPVSSPSSVLTAADFYTLSYPQSNNLQEAATIVPTTSKVEPANVEPAKPCPSRSSTRLAAKSDKGPPSKTKSAAKKKSSSNEKKKTSAERKKTTTKAKLPTTKTGRRFPMTWLERFNQLEKFKQRTDHCNPSKAKSAPLEEQQLSLWLKNQRSNFRKEGKGRKNMTPEKAQMLRELGCWGFDSNKETRRGGSGEWRKRMATIPNNGFANDHANANLQGAQPINDTLTSSGNRANNAMQEATLADEIENAPTVDL